jgi:beta-phosphoglucomutase family hydrolase
MILRVYPEAKALIFDLDGTLSDSLPLHVTTWNKVGEKLGFTFDPQLVYEMTGRPTIEFAERIAKNFKLKTDPHEIARLKQEAFHNSIEALSPIVEVISIVKEYFGKLPMAIGTGACRKSAVLQLRKLGIAHYFDFIVTADDVTRHKPEPETFLKCARLLGIKPTDCQVFEDGDLGIAAAGKAGMMVTDVRQFIKYGNW